MTIETPRSEGVNPEPAPRGPLAGDDRPGPVDPARAESVSQADERLRQERRRRVRRRVVAGGLVVVLVGAGVGYIVLDPFGGAPAKGSVDSTALAVGTATVTEGTLTSRTTASGTLSYSHNYQILNHATGTYTALPHVDGVVHQGDVLYRVNDKPVIFLQGRLPMYRDLKKNLSGNDVRQLNAALVAFGYMKKSVLDPTSTKFNWATKLGVQKLQKHLKLTQNGVLSQDTAMFLPTDELRIAGVTAKPGSAAGAGAPLASGTSTDRQATIAVDVSLQSRLHPGNAVTITLPNGKTTPGKVTSIGTEATKTSGGGATIDVTVAPTRPKSVGSLDKAPITVSIVTASVKNVLTVPVTALLALLNGQFGLEVVDAAGGRHLVRVTLGLFDDSAGTVQVSGDGIAAGTKIVVPTS